jgi:hypothetical protein
MTGFCSNHTPVQTDAGLALLDLFVYVLAAIASRAVSLGGLDLFLL